MREIVVGDIVVYRASWLKSAGICTGDICFAEGKVVAVNKKFGPDQGGLLTIEWNKPDIPDKVLACNLILKSEKHLEPR